MQDVAIIAIGRNEGDRLRRGLASVAGHTGPVIYVDSGSTDDSLKIAREAGAQIVELDMSIPFSAARARNAGAKAALALSPQPAFLQFIDGDCAIAPGWLETAYNYLSENADVTLVTGWREEQKRDVSVYNALCDVEWHRPAGEIEECGGDLMVRAHAFKSVGGYRNELIAGEDVDFCLRLEGHGKRVLLPERMTLHDADMHSFGQWWRRAVRAGHAYAHINDQHPGHFLRELRRAVFYAGILPIAAIFCLFAAPMGLWLIAAIYAANYVRTARGLRQNGQPLVEALHHSVFLFLSKWPNLIGMSVFYRRKLRKAEMQIIEYK